MRSKDNTILASMLTSLETRILSEITEVKNDIRDVKTDVHDVKVDVATVKTDIATVTANQQAAKDTHQAFRIELLGEGGRVFELERRQKSHEMWQNVKFVVVLPLTLTLHKIATAMGFKI